MLACRRTDAWGRAAHACMQARCCLGEGIGRKPESERPQAWSSGTAKAWRGESIGRKPESERPEGLELGHGESVERRKPESERPGGLELGPGESMEVRKPGHGEGMEV